MIYNLKHTLERSDQRNIPRAVCTVATLFTTAFLPSLSNAQSLDDAVRTQLAIAPGGLGCAVLLAKGGAPTGELAEICERTVYQGAESGSTGGASATPNSLPFEENGNKQNSQQSQSIQLDSNWSLFFTAESGNLDREESELEGAFESTIQRFIGGVGYIPNAKLSVSGSIDITTVDGDFSNGGSFEDESTGVNILASYQFDDKVSGQISGFFQNMSSKRERVASFSDTVGDNEVNRFDGTPYADFSPKKIGLAANVDYDYQYGKYSIMPQAGLEWTITDFGTYTESGGNGMHLTFHDDEFESFQSKIGVIASMPINTSNGVFIPQISMDWRHEFVTDGRNVIVSFAEDTNSAKFSYKANDSDKDFIDLSLGGVYIFQHGYQGFFNVQTLLAHEYFDQLIFSAGIRKEL